jgi:hypothetical protein
MENNSIITVENVPAVINANFNEVREAVKAHLEKFKGVVITPESIKDGKALIKEINVTRKELDARRKLEVGNASAPIKIFDEKMKELIALHDEAKTELTSQIAKFEAEIKVKIEEALNNELLAQWEAQGVKENFRAANIIGLVLLGNFTAKGRLTASAKSELTMRASRDLSNQQKTELRLAKLEAESYKAGLAAPLSQGHVEQFLFDDDASYEAKLANLFVSEVDRETRAIEVHEQRFQKKNEDILKVQVEEIAVEEVEVEEITLQELPAQEALQTQNAQPVHNFKLGQVMMQVTCILNIPVGAHVPEFAVENKVKEKMIEAGFTTIVNVSAIKKINAA